MYGRGNPILRHFGADELARLGTSQSMEERRLRGEYGAPEEANPARPTPEFGDYFEFDRPVASGIPVDARDFLVEEATMSSAPRSRAGAEVSYDQPSPGSYEQFSSATSPQPASYTSPEVSYQDQGAGSSGSVSGGGTGSPGSPGYYDPRPRMQRRSYGAYSSRSGSPASEASPRRSTGSPGRTPSSRSYDRGPTIQQPPFRAGVPVEGRVRRPGMTARAGGGDARRRTTSTSADPSRSPSPSPSQPLSTDPPASSSQPDQQTSDGGADSRAGGARRRTGGSLAAKITGRPAPAAAGRGGGRGGGGGGGPRRPASAAPATGAQAGAGRGPARVPAWAPAAGIANMRLDEVDEATRVALMLNDPAVRQDVGAAPGQQQQQQQQPEQQPSGDPTADAADAAAGVPEVTFYPGRSPVSPGPAGASPGSPRPGHLGMDTTRPSDMSEQFYQQYRLRKHRESQGVPDYRYSQPRSHGAHVPVAQRYFSFDEAHPALAEQHYARSPAQERMLQAERRKLQYERARAARAAARNRVASPLPTSQQLAADVDRLARVREAGRARLRELEQEGEALRQQTRQVQQRALDAIARSEHMTAATSRPPSVSPPRRRSRSPSPSAYYSGRGGGAYSRTAFGPPPGDYYRRSPSVSPGRTRPVSASPAGGYSPGSAGPYAAGPYADAAGYYDADAAAAAAAAAQAQYAREYYGAGAAAQAQRPLSAPPGHGPGSPPPGPGEAQEILDMINSVERLPQHPQLPLDSGESDPSGDHLVRASAIASSRRPMGLLAVDEQRIATGTYDRDRYQEYQRQVDLEMQRRALEGGYDSDLDRDRAAGELVHDAQKAAEEEEARLRAREEYWARENEYMDEYRQRFGPEDGYYMSPRGESSSTAPGAAAPSGPHQHQHPQRSLSDAEEDMLQQPFVPLVSPELTLSPGGGYASEGPDAYHPHRRTRRRLFFKSTVPEPFQFEEREKTRPKPISRVKLEQDLALRRAEEEAARNHRFRASPVPPAVMEPRYERMLLEAEVHRQLTRNQRLEELASMLEKPFSFYYRDQERQAEREAIARAAKDPSRFQVAFRARDVPAATKEEKFRVMMLEMEARREASRRRVDEARRAAKERAVQDAQGRRAAADRAYRERLRAVDPALHPYPPKPLGVVPDFNALHRNMEIQMARTRANIRKRVTVPQEFKLNGTTPDEQAARARKAEERRQRIILDMQVDAELLPETRWPHKSPRGKVRRTPPPAYLVEWMARSPGPTRSAAARKSSNAVAAQGGAYMTRAEREELDRRANEKLRAEMRRRADRLLKAAQERREQERLAAGGGGGGGGDGGDFGLMSDVGATAAGGMDQSSTGPAARGAAVRRREAVAGRQDNPEVYVEARHAQIERKVQEMVEDALLDQGIQAYRYVEGLDGAAGRKNNRNNKDNNNGNGNYGNGNGSRAGSPPPPSFGLDEAGQGDED